MMPDKRPLELDQFDLLAIEFADNLRLPGVGEAGEFFGKVDFVHALPPQSMAVWQAQAVILLLERPAPAHCGDCDGEDSPIGQENTPIDRRQRQTLPLRPVPQEKPQTCEKPGRLVLPDLFETA